MGRKKQACIVESDEEDEDGNLAEINPVASDEEDEDGNLAEISTVASDVEDEEQILFEDNSEISDYEDENNSEVNSDTDDNEDENLDEDNSETSEISLQGEFVYLPEDSSGFQPEEEDLKNPKVPVTYLTSDSDDSDIEADNNIKKNYIRQATPRCDEIMKAFKNYKPSGEGASNDNSLTIPESNNISEKSPASQSNSISPNSIIEESKNRITVDSNPLNNEQIESQSTTDDPLSIKLKNEIDIKPEISDEINEDLKKTEDLEISEELKPLIINDVSPEILKLMKCQVNLGSRVNLIDYENSRQTNMKNKRKRGNEIDDNPTYVPSVVEIEKPSTLSHVAFETDHQEVICAQGETPPQIDSTQNRPTLKRKRGRPPKVTKKQEENSNINVISTGLVTSLDSVTSIKKGVLNGNKDLISETNLSKTPENELSLNTQSTTNVSRKRGRPFKTKEPIQNKKVIASPTTRSNKKNNSKTLNEEVQTPIIEKPEVNIITVHLKSLADKIATVLKSEIDPDLNEVAESLLITTEELLRLQKQNTQTNNEIDESSFSSNSNPVTEINTVNETPIGNLTRPCSQKLDASYLTKTGPISSDDQHTFLTDYLTAFHNVFDDSFFQNILPVLSEILLLCMDKFTELIERNKNSAKLQSEELRKQEIELIKQSFYTMVSTYNRKFFPNFNSVLYKIDQNKTKKELIISLIFFISHSLCIKSPKFKGIIHRLRKVLLCMCKVAEQSNTLFYTVLTIPDKSFNEELGLLVKIWLILLKQKVLSIPTNALSITDCNGTIDETCDLIMSSCTNYSCEIRSLKHISFNLSDVEMDLDVMVSKDNSFSPVQEDNKPGLDDILNLTHVSLDNLFVSYFNSTNNVKLEPDEDTNSGIQTESCNSNSSEFTIQMPSTPSHSNVIKTEEEVHFTDTDVFETPANEIVSGISNKENVDSYISRNMDKDPLSF